jgi:hypothetical protein
VRRRRGLELATTLALAAALAGCGGGSGDKTSAPASSSVGAGRAETPDYVLQTARRKPEHQLVVDGRRFSAGRRDWLLAIELKLTSKRKRPLKVGPIAAELIDGRGRRYLPIYADGRAMAAPVFADRAIRPGEAVHSLVLYRVASAALRKATLRVSDPLRGARYQLPVY